MRRLRLSVRTRILAIALIPMAILVAVGVSAATYLAVEAFNLRDEVAQLDTAVPPTIEFAEALQEERRTSLLVLSGDRSVAGALKDARGGVDRMMTSGELLQAQQTIADIAPDAGGGLADQAEDTMKAFTQVRQGIDAGLLPPAQAYQFFNTILDRILIGTRAVANALPGPDAVAGANVAVELADATEAMSRGNALAAAAGGHLTQELLPEFAQQVGSYHDRLATITPTLPGQERQRMTALQQGQAWQIVASVENSILAGAGQADLPVSVADWQKAATTVNAELLDMYDDHYSAVVTSTIDNAGETATWWLVAAGALLVGVGLAGWVTLRISGRLIRRLRRLRTESLSLADQHLPRIMTRLRNGEDVDVTTEMSPLDFGVDEIGDVADAFNRAESAAVAAAVEEARTRDGVNTLFLNIAHRSQIVVHRQLELLDSAEHGEEDPNRLSVLFELDHLSTRARRNAENLIILGGEQPGRQWRNPVPLVDLVRSAVAETEDYARVHTGHMAGVAVVGSVVADLIHLVAELVENATSFSPPESRVDITSNIVGRGAVVEVADQGLGMSPEQIAQANETLRQPSALSLAKLSRDSRMGLLVVSRIAARNEVTVKLAESDYGGIRAIVLIPISLIADDARPVPVGARTGSAAVEANGVTVTGGVTTGTGQPALRWPTMEPGEPAPPAPRAPAHTAEPAARRDPYGSRDHQAGQEVQPTAGRPALPRRRRQESLAPQLSTPQETSRPQPGGGRHERSPERARDLFSEIETGTRQGRAAAPEPGTNYPDGGPR